LFHPASSRTIEKTRMHRTHGDHHQFETGTSLLRRARRHFQFVPDAIQLDERRWQQL
jgi:hypothetical protein